MVSVADRPVVGLTVGHTLKLSDIEEGDDVYFECHISAVPWIHSLEWRLNVRSLSCSEHEWGPQFQKQSCLRPQTVLEGA